MTEEMAGKKLETAEALKFILSGNARFTLVSLKTGARYTYRVRKGDEKNYPETWFVSLLTGSDNESDYSYMGMIRNGFQLTRASKFTSGSTPVKAFRWVFEKLVAGVVPADIEVWHEGRCGRCGRSLTVPESIESGYGPECLGKVA